MEDTEIMARYNEETIHLDREYWSNLSAQRLNLSSFMTEAKPRRVLPVGFDIYEHVVHSRLWPQHRRRRGGGGIMSTDNQRSCRAIGCNTDDAASDSSNRQAVHYDDGDGSVKNTVSSLSAAVRDTLQRLTSLTRAGVRTKSGFRGLLADQMIEGFGTLSLQQTKAGSPPEPGCLDDHSDDKVDSDMIVAWQRFWGPLRDTTFFFDDGGGDGSDNDMYSNSNCIDLLRNELSLPPTNTRPPRWTPKTHGPPQRRRGWGKAAADLKVCVVIIDDDDVTLFLNTALSFVRHGAFKCVIIAVCVTDGCLLSLRGTPFPVLKWSLDGSNRDSVNGDNDDGGDDRNGDFPERLVRSIICRYDATVDTGDSAAAGSNPHLIAAIAAAGCLATWPSINETTTVVVRAGAWFNGDVASLRRHETSGSTCHNADDDINRRCANGMPSGDRVQLQRAGRWALREDWDKVPSASSALRYLYTIDVAGSYVMPTHFFDEKIKHLKAMWPQDDASLRESNEQVWVLVDASIGFHRLALNSLLSLKTLGFTRFILHGYNEEDNSFWRARGFETLWSSQLIDDIPKRYDRDDSKRSYWFYPQYLRFHLWLELQEAGVVFFHTDADTYWKKDPTVSVRAGDANIAYAYARLDPSKESDSDHFRYMHRHGFNHVLGANNGIGAYRPSMQSAELFHDLVLDMVLPLLSVYNTVGVVALHDMFDFMNVRFDWVPPSCGYETQLWLHGQYQSVKFDMFPEYNKFSKTSGKAWADLAVTHSCNAHANGIGMGSQLAGVRRLPGEDKEAFLRRAAVQASWFLTGVTRSFWVVPEAQMHDGEGRWKALDFLATRIARDDASSFFDDTLSNVYLETIDMGLPIGPGLFVREAKDGLRSKTNLTDIEQTYLDVAESMMIQRNQLVRAEGFIQDGVIGLECDMSVGQQVFSSLGQVMLQISQLQQVLDLSERTTQHHVHDTATGDASASRWQVLTSHPTTSKYTSAFTDISHLDVNHRNLTFFYLLEVLVVPYNAEGVDDDNDFSNRDQDSNNASEKQPRVVYNSTAYFHCCQQPRFDTHDVIEGPLRTTQRKADVMALIDDLPAHEEVGKALNYIFFRPPL